MKVEITITPTWCYVNASPDLIHKLWEVLSFRPKNYYFDPNYQNGFWDGYIRLFDRRRSRFRRGLLYRVLHFLNSQKIQPITIDNVPPLIFRDHLEDPPYHLREYQKEAVDRILTNRVGIVKLPPRAGKTLIAIDIARRLREPIVFFTRSLDLLYQTREKFLQFAPFLEVGIAGDGKVELCKDVNIITVQTSFLAYSAESKEYQKESQLDDMQKLQIRNVIENATVVFYDEAHHAKSTTSDFILKRTQKAKVRIGLTATPHSPDESVLQVENVIGPIIYEVSYSYLIENGYLMRPRIIIFDLPEFVDSQDKTYREIYRKVVVENPQLFALVKRIVKNLTSKRESVVVQVEYVKHARDLAKFLGVPFLTGKEDASIRTELIEKLKNKEILCLVSTLFEEGIDVPSLSYTINLCGGLSFIATLQRMRSITISDQKTACGVIDFGFKEKYLKTHSKKRLDIYRQEEAFEIFVRKVTEQELSKITQEEYADAEIVETS